MKTLRNLTDEIKALDTELAPGSETHLWGDYINRLSEVTGRDPLTDYDNDVPVPDAEADWWRRAYGYLKSHPDANTDEIINAVWG